MNTIKKMPERVKAFGEGVFGKMVDKACPNGDTPLLKHYPRFPKNKQEFHDRLDEERGMGYEEGSGDGFIQGKNWAQKEQQQRRQDTLRRAAEVAIDCLVVAKDQVAKAQVSSHQDVNQSLAKMMYSTFKILEMVK